MATPTHSQLDLISASLHGDQLISTPIGDIELINNYFNDDASRRLFDEMDYQRAVQSYICSHPLVSMTTWRNSENKAFGVTGANDFVVLKSLREKRGVVTGNLTTPYIFNFTSLKEGPLVVDYPAGKTAGGLSRFLAASGGRRGPDRP